MRRAVLCCSMVLACAARPSAAQQLPLDSILSQPINSAAKYAQTITEAAASVTIITADDIRRYGYRTLEDIVRRVPDFYTSYDRNYTYLGVRGFGRPTDYNDRILLLVNGQTMNEAVSGGASLGTEVVLDPDVIERVEVVQGPGSALYGTGAMFGSVNIVTKDGGALDGTRVAAGGGSLGTLQGAASWGRVIGRALDVALSGQWTNVEGADQFYREYDSTATNHGVAHHLDWDRYGSVTGNLRWGGFTLGALAATRTKGIPTGAFGITFNDSRARTFDAQRFVELGYGAPLAATLELQLRAYAGHYRYHGVYPYDPVVTEDASDDDRVGAEAQLRWDTGPRNRLLVGAEYQRHPEARYTYWDADTTFYDHDAPFSVYSLYLQDEWQATSNLSVVLGGRFDAYGSYRPGATPRAAVVYHPWSRSTVKFIYGQAFRAPSAYEANFSDPLSGYKRAVDLQPERIATTEAVWQQRLSDAWFASASVYRYSIRDLIDTYLDPTDSLLQYRNIARVRATGASVALNAAFANGATAYASYALEEAADVATDVRLTNSPEHIAKAGVSAPLGRYVVAGGEVRYESKRRTVQGTWTDPYWWTGVHVLVAPGLAAGRSARGLLEHLELSIAVRNLFNTRYALPGGFEHRQPAIEQDGRTVSVRLSLRL